MKKEKKSTEEPKVVPHIVQYWEQLTEEEVKRIRNEDEEKEKKDDD